MPSLVELIRECELTLCIVTETWLKKNVDRVAEELIRGEDLDIISFCRQGTKRGGGVSIVSDKNKISLTENKLKRENFELVSAVGKLAGEKRTIVIYGVYLPPSLTKANANKACEIINDNINEVNVKYDLSLIHI